MKNIKNLSPATSAAGIGVLSGTARERFGNAPIASAQGTTLSFAGYAAKTDSPAQHVMTLGTAGVVRTDDARVPEPRGRQY